MSSLRDKYKGAQISANKEIVANTERLTGNREGRPGFHSLKEGQNVFNIIPQQDLYDPWGRPGAGAPLIHASTGQKFTRYSGSLQDKLVFCFV